MDANAYTGVRAEPKFLRDPTSLESISSGISRISSYVTSNLPKRKSSMTSPFDPQFQQQYQQQQQQQQHIQQQRKEEEEEELNDMEGYDTITYASFDKLEYMNLSCLLLGYHDGFQLWDITNPDNVHELCSIRDKDLFGTVSYIHLIKSTDEGPLLAIISETVVKDASTKDNTQQHNRTESNNSTIPCSTSIIIYSLMSQSIIKEINNFSDEEDDTTVVTCIKSNHKVIVLGCLSRQKSSIHILSTTDFEPFASPLTDIYHDSTAGPIFTLGTRLIAYATNAAVLNSDPIMTSLTNKSISYTGFGVLQGEKDVKGAAKDIAKEVVSGMKTLGEFGYTTLSNYFGNTSQSTTPQSAVEYGSSPTTTSTTSTTNRRTSNHSSPQDLFNTSVNTNTNTTTTKKMIPSGMIMIRDILKLPTTPTRNLSVSTVAHFRPHTHPVTCLNFNQAGTLLLSASKQGHTFHIFSILTNTTTVANASHLYSLSRGITDAQVEDCQFSIDSTWCAISTARGTTHVYAINPYGGKPEISGHVHGKVNNPSFHPFMAKSKSKATTLSSVVRIKQRRKMPGNLSGSSQDDGTKFSTNGTNNSFAYYGQPQYIPAVPPVTSSRSTINKERRAKITSMFVTGTKAPYLVNNSHIYSAKNENANNASVGSIKQQATSMLSSFGSSMSHLSYSPNQGQTQKSKWNDKSDMLMFGFDEEYDDSAKMINDEIGYQDLYSFHPDGILTLHRCWVVKTVVKKRENGRNLEKLDLSLREEDVAEWRVARNSDWDQVKVPLAEVPAKKKKKAPVYNSKKLWLSNAEITTYASVPDDAPLWTQHQFKFQTFKEKDLQRVLHAGIIPATETMVMLKGMPEPVSSRIDRVRKTTTRIANDNVEENMEDALAELEDNISKAMQSSFSPSSNSISNSPAATSLKWLSSSANAAMNAGVPSPSSVNNKSFLDRNSSVSFEDAYLIHMGSGPSPEPSMNGLQHSSLIQFEEDMLHEDIIRLEEDDDSDSESSLQKDVYSPDGDNEVAHPSESMFVEIRERKDSDGESNTSW